MAASRLELNVYMCTKFDPFVFGLWIFSGAIV